MQEVTHERAGYLKRAIVLIWLACTVVISCENPFISNKCPDCYVTEPFEAQLKVLLTKSSNDCYVTALRIYLGRLEDRILVGTYNPSLDEWYAWVKVNKMYTVEVIYMCNGVRITCIDSTIPHVKKETLLCDQPCFLIKDNILKMKLVTTNLY